MLVNGAHGNTINAEDRGLAYGDGVFRTLRMQAGRPVCWERQYAKLQRDCSALKISCPSALVLSSELQQLGKTQPEGIAKIIITRGVSIRGYAPSAQSETTPFSASIHPQHIRLTLQNSAFECMCAKFVWDINYCWPGSNT